MQTLLSAGSHRDSESLFHDKIAIVSPSSFFAADSNKFENGHWAFQIIVMS